jgi:hypothetical protein
MLIGTSHILAATFHFLASNFGDSFPHTNFDKGRVYRRYQSSLDAAFDLSMVEIKLDDPIVVSWKAVSSAKVRFCEPISNVSWFFV